MVRAGVVGRVGEEQLASEQIRDVRLRRWRESGTAVSWGHNGMLLEAPNPDSNMQWRKAKLHPVDVRVRIDSCIPTSGAETDSAPTQSRAPARQFLRSTKPLKSTSLHEMTSPVGARLTMTLFTAVVRGVSELCVSGKRLMLVRCWKKRVERAKKRKRLHAQETKVHTHH